MSLLVRGPADPDFGALGCVAVVPQVPIMAVVAAVIVAGVVAVEEAGPVDVW